jgi:hypothetical protein
MLNQYLKTGQTDRVDIRDCSARVGNTGIGNEQSANFGANRINTSRIQRMRRRYQRSALSGNLPRGWVARFA